MFEKISEKTTRKIEIGIAIYLIISVILDQLANQTLLNVFWFCVMSAIFLAYGSLSKSKIIPSSILVMSIFAQFPWILDFFLEMFGIGLGRNSFLLNYGWEIFFTSINLHAVLIPFSLFLVLKRGYAHRSLIFSIIYIIFILVIPFFFTSPVENINCAFVSCDTQILEPESNLTYLPFFLIWGLAYRLIIISILHFGVTLLVNYVQKSKNKKSLT